MEFDREVTASHEQLYAAERADAAKLNASLLPDFTRTRNAFIEFDITNVRALKEDENEKYARLAIAVGNKPWLTVNEARTEIGYDPIEGGDDMAEPEPEPQPVPEQLQQEQPTEDAEAQELEDTPTSKAIDLGRWRRKAIKAVKAGRSAVVKFESDTIPLDEQERIKRGLAECKTADDVCTGFASKDDLPILSVELKRANDLLEAVAVR